MMRVDLLRRDPLAILDRAEIQARYRSQRERHRVCETAYRERHPERVELASRIAQATYRERHPDRILAAQARHRAKPEAKQRRAELDRLRRQRRDPSYLRAKKNAWLSETAKASSRAWRKSAAGVMWRKGQKRVAWAKAYATSEKERARARTKAKGKKQAEYNRAYMQTEAGKLMNQRRRHRRRSALLGVKSDFTKEQWGALQVAYGKRCAYCGCEKPLTQDHVRAVKRRGSDTIENVVPACKSCNSRKRDLAIQVAFRMFGIDADVFWARHEAAVAKVRGEP